MKFHVGLPTYNDWDGVYFTATSLKTHHKEHVGAISVIDNNPENERVASKLRDWCGKNAVRYVPLHSPKGPCGAKDMVFRLSTLPTVCLDSHVLLAPGSFEALAAAWKDEPALYQGVLTNEDGSPHATHLEDKWGGDGMRGTWSTNRDYLKGVSHEIGAQGCGMLACDPKHWPGFNPAFRGFGGEEWYIQDKMRLRGGKVYLVPGFKWIHRWACIRPDGITHTPLLWDKARNQYIGHKELGRDVKQVIAAFPNLPKYQWKQIENGAEAPIMPCGSCNIVGSQHKTPSEWHVFNKTDDRYDHCTGKTIDAGKNFDKSVTAILASGITDLSVLHPKGPAVASRFGVKWLPGDPISTNPIDCDTLVLGDHGSVITLGAELQRWHEKVAKRIFIPTDNNRLKVVMEHCRNHREWSVYKHGMGWVVITKDDADKVKPPRLVSLDTISRFAKALKSHLADGAKKVDEETYNKRLSACDVCPARNNNRCGHCGCFVDAKAAMASEKCPIGEW